MVDPHRVRPLHLSSLALSSHSPSHGPAGLTRRPSLARSWAALELVLLIVVVPETYLPAVLKKKAVKLRKAGRTDVRAQIEVDTRTIPSVLKTSCSRPFRASLVLVEPRCESRSWTGAES